MTWYSFHLILNPVQLLCLVSTDSVRLYSPVCHVCQRLLSAGLCFNAEQEFRVKSVQGKIHIPYISHWVIINVPSHNVYSSDTDDVESPESPLQAPSLCYALPKKNKQQCLLLGTPRFP